MTLIRDGKLAQDEYHSLAEDLPLPESGPVLLSWNRWQELAADQPLRRSLGVRLPNTLDISAIWQSVRSAVLICLEFPSFADGRAYSQAQLIRSRHGFAGELRATGQAVVADQLQGLLRCGFNSFELRPDQYTEQCSNVLIQSFIPYQHSTDRLTTVAQIRTAIGPVVGILSE